jgi:hypothetical protein
VSVVEGICGKMPPTITVGVGLAPESFDGMFVMYYI